MTAARGARRGALAHILFRLNTTRLTAVAVEILRPRRVSQRVGGVELERVAKVRSAPPRLACAAARGVAQWCQLLKLATLTG